MDTIALVISLPLNPQVFLFLIFEGRMYFICLSYKCAQCLLTGKIKVPTNNESSLYGESLPLRLPMPKFVLGRRKDI